MQTCVKLSIKIVKMSSRVTIGYNILTPEVCSNYHLSINSLGRSVHVQTKAKDFVKMRIETDKSVSKYEGQRGSLLASKDHTHCEAQV